MGNANEIFGVQVSMKKRMWDSRCPSVLIPLSWLVSRDSYSITKINSETDINQEKRPGPKRKFIFQPSICRCELSVLGRVYVRVMPISQKQSQVQVYCNKHFLLKKVTILAVTGEWDHYHRKVQLYKLFKQPSKFTVT